MTDIEKARKELTDFQVRWHYERIVLCFTDMNPYLYALRERAPDPELKKAAGEAWDTIRSIIVGLRERFGLAWLDSEEYLEDIDEELEKEFRHKPPVGEKKEFLSYLCYECGFYTNSYDEAKAHNKETAHTSFRKSVVVEEHVLVF